MKSINLNDLSETMVVSEQEAADVKGGPAYIKYGDIKGDVSARSGFTGGVRVATGDLNG